MATSRGLVVSDIIYRTTCHYSKGDPAASEESLLGSNSKNDQSVKPPVCGTFEVEGAKTLQFEFFKISLAF